MSAHDISRHLFQASNHYTGTRMQQGRVVLDSDFNEARMLDEEDQRHFVVAVVGPHGSPDRGFTVENVSVAGLTWNFDIADGTYYLGGYRHEIGGGQSFRGQRDWRQLLRDDVRAVQVPPVPTQPRNDLVYLLGWQQGVGAVEDQELDDPAIAGHDTGYRQRFMQRVMVLADGPGTCKEAFDGLVASLEAGGHQFDRVNFELKSGARMGSRRSPVEPAEDLCKPEVLQGLAGAEHQAIRVQLIAPDRFIWGLDNASTMVRCTMAISEVDVTLTLTTPLRDLAHAPRVGHILELLPWGADLPNGEHVADHPVAGDVGGGVLLRVITPYDPGTGKITAAVAVEHSARLTKIAAWYQTIASAYLYARVWEPGDDAVAGPFGIGITLDQPIRLRGTDYEIGFTGLGIVGDYWILGARPATAQPIVPWNLRDGGPPHGPRRFYSPLAVLRWTIHTTLGAVAEVSSCRRTFRPLTRLRGCCTVTVGDGKTSFGDFTSIQAAVDALPRDEKGRICVLPGEYRERVVLTDRSDLILEGCGARTILRTPEGNDSTRALIEVTRGTRLTIRKLTLEAFGQFGITLLGNGVALTSAVLEDLRVTTRRDPDVPAPDPWWNLWLPASGPAPFPVSTIAAHRFSDLTIRRCYLEMSGNLSAAANVFLSHCGRSRVSDCQILTPSVDGDVVSKAWGGLQTGGGDDVVIENNIIRGGLGHGITLGRVITGYMNNDYATAFEPNGWFSMADDPDCPSVTSEIPDGIDEDDGPATTLTASTQADVVIRGNRISEMGASGVSVPGFWPDYLTLDVEGQRMFRSPNLLIEDNLIEANCRRPYHGVPGLHYGELVAFGGVVLADTDNLRIRDNRIVGNGGDHRYPICGIYVFHGEDLAIENNEVRDNGVRVGGSAFAGNRAGIALRFVGRLATSYGFDSYETEPDSLRPAARIRGNVVYQPAGRALELYGVGPMLIEGNVFGSGGLTHPVSSERAHCIEIHNIGLSAEIGVLGYVPGNLGYLPAPPLPTDEPPPSPDTVDGRILFTGNQVHFRPVAGASANIRRAVSLQSYDDVAVLDNQFVTTFPDGVGDMLCDTVVTAWSTRTNHNRWEDPIGTLPNGSYQTDISASTLGVMNFTKLNEASRCIHVQVSVLTDPIDNNGDGTNLTYTDCDTEPGFAALLAPTP